MCSKHCAAQLCGGLLPSNSFFMVAGTHRDDKAFIEPVSIKLSAETACEWKADRQKDRVTLKLSRLLAKCINFFSINPTLEGRRQLRNGGMQS